MALAFLEGVGCGFGRPDQPLATPLTRFDCDSIGRRPFDVLRYDRAAALRPK